MPHFAHNEQELKSHPDLTHMLGLADLETGTAVSGARGYFLLNEGVLLNQVGPAVVHVLDTTPWAQDSDASNEPYTCSFASF